MPGLVEVDRLARATGRLPRSVPLPRFGRKPLLFFRVRQRTADQRPGEHTTGIRLAGEINDP